MEKHVLSCFVLLLISAFCTSSCLRDSDKTELKDFFFDFNDEKAVYEIYVNDAEVATYRYETVNTNDQFYFNKFQSQTEIFKSIYGVQTSGLVLEELLIQNKPVQILRKNFFPFTIPDEGEVFHVLFQFKDPLDSTTTIKNSSYREFIGFDFVENDSAAVFRNVIETEIFTPDYGANTISFFHNEWWVKGKGLTKYQEIRKNDTGQTDTLLFNVVKIK